MKINEKENIENNIKKQPLILEDIFTTYQIPSVSKWVKLKSWATKKSSTIGRLCGATLLKSINFANELSTDYILKFVTLLIVSCATYNISLYFWSFLTTLSFSAAGLSFFLSIISYIMGFLFSILAAIKYNEFVQKTTNTPLYRSITYLVVSACLIGLPSIMTVASVSTFGV
jgi:hypothetical protein